MQTWSFAANCVDLDLGLVPTLTRADVIIALLMLSASLPPPAGMTFEANSIPPMRPDSGLGAVVIR